MHLSSTIRILTGALGLLTASAALRAQGQASTMSSSDMPTQYATIVPEGGRVPFVPQVASIKAAPFQASFQTESRQVLADGSTITNSQSGKIARDSVGRTYLEITTTRGPASHPFSYTSININDPTTRTHIVLMPDSHIAHRYERPAPSAGAAQLRPIPTSGTGAEAGAETSGTSASGPAIRSVNPDDLNSRPAAPATNRSSLPPMQKEDLGEESIDGVAVRHYRETRTIPAGEQGNDRDLIINAEFWYSRQLRLNLRATRNDPRSGEENLTVSGLDRSEPQASLFEIPADYKVTDVPMGVAGVTASAGTVTTTEAPAPAEKP